MKLPIILLLMAVSQWIASPILRAQVSSDDSLDELLTWSLHLHGEKSLVTKLPKLFLDETDKQGGATALAFETAGEGNPALWLTLRAKLNPTINKTDYESLTFKYKVTPTVLDGLKEKPSSMICMGIMGSEYAELRSKQDIYIDGDWHTLEVPMSSLEQPKKAAEIASYNGEDADVIYFTFYFTRASAFDVAVRIDNIQLKPVR
jgi:hypothetical protein